MISTCTNHMISTCTNLSSIRAKRSIQVVLASVGARCSQSTKIVSPPWQLTSQELEMLKIATLTAEFAAIQIRRGWVEFQIFIYS